MKYVILQNTVTPYRISLFNKLNELGLDFKVFYMTNNEKGRSWKIDMLKLSFSYYIYKGIYISLPGYELHLNIKMLFNLLLERNSTIILGSSWNDLNVFIICLFKRLHLLRSPLIFWSEANYMSIGARKKNKMRDYLRSFVFNTSNNGIIVPGKIAVESFKKWDIHVKKFYTLPNVIEEETFFNMPSSCNKSCKSNLPSFVIPARLIEKIKGIINFFTAIGPENILKADFYILGDGPDEEKIKKFISNNGYNNNIHLMGFCQVDKLHDYYTHCDAFLLPSFTDQNPLCVIEALACGLPILVSERCGNHYETLSEGENGYKFDPDNHYEIRCIFEMFMSRYNEWKTMGKISKELYMHNFKQDVVIQKFLDSIK